jgi:CheY-like chemotaxis protein
MGLMIPASRAQCLHRQPPSSPPGGGKVVLPASCKTIIGSGLIVEKERLSQPRTVSPGLSSGPQIPASGNAEMNQHWHAGWVRRVIVDDNEPFLMEARELLEREGIDVVGVARTSAEAVQTIAELRPDVTLVDIDLGGDSGFDLVRALADAPNLSTSRVILISVHAQPDFADLIDASPAAGFVSKTELSARASRISFEAGPTRHRNSGSGRVQKGDHGQHPAVIVTGLR